MGTHNYNTTSITPSGPQQPLLSPPHHHHQQLTQTAITVLPAYTPDNVSGLDSGTSSANGAVAQPQPQSPTQRKRGRPPKQPKLDPNQATLDNWPKKQNSVENEGNAVAQTVPALGPASLGSTELNRKRKREGEEAEMPSQAPDTAGSTSVIGSSQLDSGDAQAQPATPRKPRLSPKKRKYRKLLPGQTTLDGWGNGDSSIPDGAAKKKQPLPRKSPQIVRNPGVRISKTLARSFYRLTPIDMQSLSFVKRQKQRKESNGTTRTIIMHLYVEQEVEFKAWKKFGGCERFVKHLFDLYCRWFKRQSSQGTAKNDFPVSKSYQYLVEEWKEELYMHERIRGYEEMAA